MGESNGRRVNFSLLKASKKKISIRERAMGRRVK
jgi:hypothetical protein